jgi:hypothetical protein
LRVNFIHQTFEEQGVRNFGLQLWQFNMRLLNTETLDLVEFVGSNIPSVYGILSHTWSQVPDEELLFADVKSPSFRTDAKWKSHPGYKKVKRFCNICADFGFKWAWADTVCINKSDSAELSEAINSMYAWYRDSTMCIVYLADYHKISKRGSVLIGGGASRPEPVRESFWKSRWWTRGWTLQELVAPRVVKFYEAQWDFVANKTELIDEIAQRERINHLVLEGASPSICNIAERMSWAARRKTTRIEDMAYSLLGIFDVKMPFLYGEGIQAFRRLQEEIIKSSEDDSLLAWNDGGLSQFGVLADSPARFHNVHLTGNDGGVLCRRRATPESRNLVSALLKYSELTIKQPQFIRILLSGMDTKTSEEKYAFTVDLTSRGLRTVTTLFEREFREDNINTIAMYHPLNIMTRSGELLAMPVSQNGHMVYQKTPGHYFLIDVAEFLEIPKACSINSIAFFSTSGSHTFYVDNTESILAIQYWRGGITKQQQQADRNGIGIHHSSFGEGVCFFEATDPRWNRKFLIATAHNWCSVWASKSSIINPKAWLSEVFSEAGSVSFARNKLSSLNSSQRDENQMLGWQEDSRFVESAVIVDHSDEYGTLAYKIVVGCYYTSTLLDRESYWQTPLSPDSIEMTRVFDTETSSKVGVLDIAEFDLRVQIHDAEEGVVLDVPEMRPITRAETEFIVQQLEKSWLATNLRRLSYMRAP